MKLLPTNLISDSAITKNNHIEHRFKFIDHNLFMNTPYRCTKTVLGRTHRDTTGP